MARPDDTTCPNILRVLSLTTFLTACSLLTHLNLQEMHPKVRCLHAAQRLIPSSLQAPHDPPLLSPRDVTKRLQVRMLRPPTASKVECLEEACLDTNGIEKNESDATTSEDEASAHVCRKKRRLIASRTAAMANHSEKGLSFLKHHEVKISGRYHQASQEFLQHTLVANNALVADTEVDEALVAFFNEKYRLGYSKRHSAGGCVLITFRSMGNSEGTSCRASIVPSRVGGVAPPPGAEIHTRGACVEGHFFSGIPATRALEDGHLPVVKGDMLLQPREPSEHFARRHSSSHTRDQPPAPSASLPKDATTEIQDVRGQRHGRVVLSLVRELARDSSSCRPKKFHGTCIQLQLSRLLAGVEQDDRGGRTGNLHSAPGALHGPTQRAFHRRCSQYSHTRQDKMTRWKHDVHSVRLQKWMCAMLFS